MSEAIFPTRALHPSAAMIDRPIDPRSILTPDKVEYFSRPTFEVAVDLLGLDLISGRGKSGLRARIVEVEAYTGLTDPASHAARGVTPRNAVMFGRAGHAYVYLIYGMYHCINVTTEPDGVAGAVLIRAAEIRGSGWLVPLEKRESHLSGPGKLCAGFQFDRSHTGTDLTRGEIRLAVSSEPPARIGCSTRIGIRKAAERWWRFFDTDSESVSVHRRAELTMPFERRASLVKKVQRDV